MADTDKMQEAVAAAVLEEQKGEEEQKAATKGETRRKT